MDGPAIMARQLRSADGGPLYSRMRTVQIRRRFESPLGPGDARPNALQIVRDQGLMGKLADKVILVTGASSGLVSSSLCHTSNTSDHFPLLRRKVEQDIEHVEEWFS